MYLGHVSRFTHILHILFAGFDQWYSLLDISDLAGRQREEGRRYEVITGGFVSEGASLDIFWTSLLKLLTEGIPKLGAVKLGVGEDARYPDHCQSMRNHTSLGQKR